MLPAAAILILALAQPAAAPPIAPPTFSLSIPSLSFRTSRVFAALDGPAPLRESRAEIRPRILIRPINANPILGADPRLSLSRLTDAAGRDLLSSASIGRADRWVPSRAGYIFPGSSSWSARGYSGALTVWRSGVSLPRLPARLSAIDGQVRVRVVEDDATRELIIGPGPSDTELVPGLRLVFDPSGGPTGTGELRSIVDPARDPGRVPELGAVLTDRTSSPAALRFDAAGRSPFALTKAEAQGVPVRVHIVYQTRDVLVPLHAEGIAIAASDAPPAHAALAFWPQTTAIVSESAGCEVRLLRLIASGTVPVEDRAAREERDLWLSLGLTDRADPAAPASPVRRLRCHIDELTDERGQPVGRLADQKPDGNPPASAAAEYLPEFPTSRWASPDRTLRSMRTLGVRIPLAAVPARLGRVAGHIEIREAVREIQRDFDLTPAPGPVEVTPGMRLIIRSPTVRRGQQPVPREDWVEVAVDLPPDAARDGKAAPDTRAVRIDAVDFLDADGKHLDGPAALTTRLDGRTARYIAMQGESVEKAAKLRIRVVLEDRDRVVPFVLENVPCTVD